MKNFEFKSQICTNKEQSERLLVLGLKKETADMTWFRRSTNANFESCTSSYTEWAEEILPIADDYTLRDIIPAWSLHRLVEIMFKGDIEGFVGYNIHANSVNIMYEYAISNIEALIKMGTFNKDYLEEKK